MVRFFSIPNESSNTYHLLSKWAGLLFQCFMIHHLNENVKLSVKLLSFFSSVGTLLNNRKPYFVFLCVFNLFYLIFEVLIRFFRLHVCCFYTYVFSLSLVLFIYYFFKLIFFNFCISFVSLYSLSSYFLGFHFIFLLFFKH